MEKYSLDMGQIKGLKHKLIKKVDRQSTVVFSKVAPFLLIFFGLPDYLLY